MCNVLLQKKISQWKTNSKGDKSGDIRGHLICNDFNNLTFVEQINKSVNFYILTFEIIWDDKRRGLLQINVPNKDGENVLSYN